ncbi:hypothetical protein EXIGLDRAFT_838071 [Exidia glandulosa HHB12029]|uniref:Uncharacterized protein n=1 Tax=Exidia glandulosa HHB12029 TaxID=1314781 RepID=A0A165G623_EXIGL|nr:hypothetical protein EXIGLDRAFT_838071 [Exidia glandulosa HHB12029]
MSTTSSSPAPFVLFAEKLDRNNDRPWRVQAIPQLREGKTQWVTYTGAMHDREVILNQLL